MTPIDKVREICLAFPDATEGVHYGEIVFKAKGKMFASAGDKKGPCRIIVKLEPEHAAMVLAMDPRFTKYTYEKACVAIEASKVKDWDEIARLVEESYRVSVGGSPAKKKTAPKKKRVPTGRR